MSASVLALGGRAADAAEVALSRALQDLTPEQAQAEGERAITALENA